MPSEMESNNAEYVALGGEGSAPKLENIHKVSIIPLMFFIFYEVSEQPWFIIFFCFKIIYVLISITTHFI